MPIDQARALGATALFGEKYGEVVRVVEIGPDSLELCGGTHVSRSGTIGTIMVLQESGVSAGVRRIECLAGPGATSELLRLTEEANEIAALLKSDLQRLPEKVERVLGRVRGLEREVEWLKGKLGSVAVAELTDAPRTSAGGVRAVIARVDAPDADGLKGMVDVARVKLGSGVVALGSVIGGSGMIVAGATPDVATTINVGALVKEAAKNAGGRGGGRADFAQAGGLDPAKVDAALESFFGLLR
jgi:alanyl-tRNA synthetase